MKFISTLALISAMIAAVELVDRLCTVSGKECVGEDIWSHHVPILNNCVAYCRRNAACKSAFLDSSYICHLRANQCELSSLKVTAGGTDIHRPEDGEKCPSGRTLHEAPKDVYGDEYCQIAGKKCAGDSLYPRPWTFHDLADDCKTKCDKIITCGMFNYNEETKKCDLKRNVCDEADLLDDSDQDVYRKVLKDETCTKLEKPIVCEDPLCKQMYRTCMKFSSNKFIEHLPYRVSGYHCYSTCKANPDCAIVDFLFKTYECNLYEAGACEDNLIMYSSTRNIYTQDYYSPCPADCSLVYTMYEE